MNIHYKDSIMKKLLQVKSHELMGVFSKNWAWFFAFGFVLVILGTIAICAATMTTLISVIFLGVLLAISGIVVVIDTFTLSGKKWSSYSLHLFMGLLYFGVGVMLIKSPVSGSMSLTLLLGIFYTILGVSRVLFASTLRLPRWGWGFFSGLITLLLGTLILANWPGSSLFIIGLFIGVDLLVCGWAYIMASLAAHNCVTC
jgi:uncharacterized membrane protein HdeD (DUF308 family)